MNEEETLKKRLAEIQEAKQKLTTLRTLESYSDKEKCEVFNKFYNHAKKIMTEKIDKGYVDDDTDNWCFEMVMELLGKQVWEIYNMFG